MRRHAMRLYLHLVRYFHPTPWMQIPGGRRARHACCCKSTTHRHLLVAMERSSQHSTIQHDEHVSFKNLTVSRPSLGFFLSA